MTLIRRFLLILLCFLPAILHSNPETKGFLEDSRRARLKSILAERKIPFEERPLFAEYGSFGTSLHISLPAAAASSGLFILAVPLSFSDDDRRDLPYAFEVALAFIDKARETALSGEEQKIDILVAFLGDEWPALPQETADPRDAEQGAFNTGLRDLYSRLEVPEDTALVYLDMYREAGELVVHHGARKALAPLNLLQGLGQLCDSRGIPYVPAIGSNELYKLALVDGPPVLEFALNRELPALYLRGSGIPMDGTGSPAPGAMLATLLLDYAVSLDIGMENPDYHYLIFRFAGRSFFVPESTTVLFFLTVAALFFLAALVYSVVFRFRLLIQWKIFLKRSWILILFYALLILSLKGAAVVTGIYNPDAGNAAAWSGRSGLFYGTAAAQILFGIALFTLLSPVLDLVYVPRRANFYGSASVILVALEILLAALLDITFIPIFVWAFVCIFLAACVKKPPLIWLCCFLALLLGFSSLRNLIQSGNRRLASLILSGDTPLIFYIALIALPIFTTFKRGILLMTAGPAASGELIPRPLKSPVGIIPRGLFLVITAAILWGSAFYLTRNLLRTPELRTIDDTDGESSYLKVEVRDRILLERRTLGIKVDAWGTPLRFNLYLEEGDEIPLIYAAPMPFRYIEDAPTSIEFILGEEPPNPFTTEIVLPIDCTGVLRVEALYLNTDYRIKIIHRYPIDSASRLP
ncbi:hypothetical protein AGMMS4952_18340 [Spirochaetia bacterium]|nr:hypothetical protein AGMMS4952_18340 [Spirochaetia bacterium]